MKKGPLGLVTAVGALLVVAVIGLGILQAEDVRNRDLAVPTPTAEPVQELEQAPARGYELAGSDILFRIRGGGDPCRFLYTNNRVTTVMDTELDLWFVAGVWDTDLEEDDEMHLYGPNGPHQLEIVGPSGHRTMSLDVAYGAQDYVTVAFPEEGLYRLRHPALGVVGLIYARPADQPGTGVGGDWCPS